MNAAARRWYREPLVWLLVLLPLAGMVATFALIKLGAGTSFDSAPDEVRRSAQVQQRDLAADERALALGYRTNARFQAGADGSGELRIDLGPLPPADYVLEQVHPVEARDDRRAEAARGAAELVAGDFDPDIAWHLRLAPASGEWRLVGRWDPSRADRPLELHPAFAAAPPEPRP